MLRISREATKGSFQAGHKVAHLSWHSLVVGGRSQRETGRKRVSEGWFAAEQCQLLASQVGLVVKNLPANAGDIREVGLIPESRRSAGGGHGFRL